MRFARTSFAIATVCLLFSASGCRRFPLRRHRSSAQRSIRLPQRLRPLASVNRTEQLLVPHFASAAVSVPVGAHWARPIVIALHGQGETKEAICEAFSAVLNAETFVLCPELGLISDAKTPSSTCSSVECLAEEIREGLISLRKRYPRYVARNEVALAGHGSGAARAVPIALQNPTVFSVVWLVDGGVREWATALSVAYAQRGGKYLGLACGDRSCETEALRVTTSARTAGLTTVLVKTGPTVPKWTQESIEALRETWRKSKPAGWPWSVPDKI
jgi:hypothetical protein